MSIACGTYNLTGNFNTNYEFSSWSKTGSGAIANTNTLSTTYTVNGAGTITLNGKSSVSYMQDFTNADCQSQASSGNVTVVDSRDNSDYTVRYINGACWMTQNLRLSGGRTLTSSDSNVASSWSFPSTSLTSGNSYTDARSLISSNTSYGGYYNYCAASAGTVCSSGRGDATYSICPRNWRLPTRYEMGDIIDQKSLFSLVHAGGYWDGAPFGAGDYDYWWSATQYNALTQYYLGFQGAPTLTLNYTNKYHGISVRCIRSN